MKEFIFINEYEEKQDIDFFNERDSDWQISSFDNYKLILLRTKDNTIIQVRVPKECYSQKEIKIEDATS